MDLIVDFFNAVFSNAWTTAGTTLGVAGGGWVVRGSFKAYGAVKTGLTTVGSLDGRLQTIEQALGPNGGASLRDAIDRTEMNTRRARATAMAMTNAIERPIMLFCDQGLCFYVNRAFEELTGYSRDEMIGNGWFAALNDINRTRVTESWHHTIQDQRLLDAMVTWRHRAGFDVQTQFNARLDRDDNGLLGWTVVMTVIKAHQPRDV